ncbi:MAG: hypothetical protein J6M38_07185 [Lentisphaeria bacterium]|nr:hypothetical protein [Lentisphaeria bacterium]
MQDFQLCRDPAQKCWLPQAKLPDTPKLENPGRGVKSSKVIVRYFRRMGCNGF